MPPTGCWDRLGPGAFLAVPLCEMPSASHPLLCVSLTLQGVGSCKLPSEQRGEKLLGGGEVFPFVLQTCVASLALLFPHHGTQPWARLNLGTKSWPAQSPKHTRASMIQSQKSLCQLINYLWSGTCQKEAQPTSVEVARL